MHKKYIKLTKNNTNNDKFHQVFFNQTKYIFFVKVIIIMVSQLKFAKTTKTIRCYYWVVSMEDYIMHAGK